MRIFDFFTIFVYSASCFACLFHSSFFSFIYMLIRYGELSIPSVHQKEPRKPTEKKMKFSDSLCNAPHRLLVFAPGLRSVNFSPTKFFFFLLHFFLSLALIDFNCPSLYLTSLISFFCHSLLFPFHLKWANNYKDKRGQEINQSFRLYTEPHFQFRNCPRLLKYSVTFYFTQ